MKYSEITKYPIKKNKGAPYFEIRIIDFIASKRLVWYKKKPKKLSFWSRNSGKICRFSSCRDKSCYYGHREIRILRKFCEKTRKRLVFIRVNFLQTKKQFDLE